MNDFSGRNRSQQQKCVHQFREHADADLFFNALTDGGMLDKLESLLPEALRDTCGIKYSCFENVRKTKGPDKV